VHGPGVEQAGKGSFFPAKELQQKLPVFQPDRKLCVRAGTLPSFSAQTHGLLCTTSKADPAIQWLPRRYKYPFFSRHPPPFLLLRSTNDPRDSKTTTTTTTIFFFPTTNY
jgi:hypothetical protein